MYWEQGQFCMFLYLNNSHTHLKPLTVHCWMVLSSSSSTSYLSSPGASLNHHALTAISHSIQHIQVGRLMHNYICCNEFSLSQHWHMLHVLAPQLWDGINCCMTTYPDDRERPAYSEGLHSCIPSGETGNYIKSAFWMALIPSYDLAPLLPFCLSYTWKVTGILGQEPILHPRRYSNCNWMKLWAAWPDLIPDHAASRRSDQRPPEGPFQPEVSSGAVIHSKRHMESVWDWQKGDGERLQRASIFGCKFMLTKKNTFCILKYIEFIKLNAKVYQDIQQGIYLTKCFEEQ